MSDRKLLKEARDLIVMCSLLDKSNQCNEMVDRIDNQLSTPLINKEIDFDKLLQKYRQEFVNGGGFVKIDTFESGTEPYEVFEWFKNKISK